MRLLCVCVQVQRNTLASVSPLPLLYPPFLSTLLLLPSLLHSSFFLHSPPFAPPLSSVVPPPPPFTPLPSSLLCTHLGEVVLISRVEAGTVTSL